MAVLKKQTVGILRGTMGNTVYKWMNEKNIAVSRPSHYRMSHAPHEVEKRNRFSVNGKFAKAIMLSALLYNVWKKEKAPATTGWNKICKVNYKRCGVDRPTEKNIITPAGFPLTANKIAVLPDGVEVVLEPFDAPQKEEQIIFVMIVSFYKPKIRKRKYFELLVMEGCEKDDLKLTFRFDDEEKRLARRYKNRTIFLAAVTVDKDGKFLRHSETMGKEL
jgi:hypothetical protein